MDVETMALLAGLLLLQAGIAWVVAALLACLAWAWYVDKVGGFVA